MAEKLKGFLGKVRLAIQKYSSTRYSFLRGGLYSDAAICKVDIFPQILTFLTFHISLLSVIMNGVFLKGVFDGNKSFKRRGKW